MPKSSSANRTPTPLQRGEHRIGAGIVALEEDAFEQPSRDGSTPAVASAEVTIAGSAGLRTAAVKRSPPHAPPPASWPGPAGVRSAHSPIGAIRPASSATGMNLPGDIQPGSVVPAQQCLETGDRPGNGVDHRPVEQAASAVRQRTQIVFELAAPGVGVEVGIVEVVAAAPAILAA